MQRWCLIGLPSARLARLLEGTSFHFLNRDFFPFFRGPFGKARYPTQNATEWRRRFARFASASGWRLNAAVMLSVPSLYAACSTVNCCYYCSGTLSDMHGSACRAYPSSHADSDTAELVSFLRLRASLPAGFENSSLCCECSKPQTKQLSATCINQILLQESGQPHAVPCSAVFASPPPLHLCTDTRTRCIGLHAC